MAAILHKATRDHPKIDYRFGTTITELLANDDDSVEVKLSDGETQEYDLLVAADGQWSKVRKQCFPAESVDVVDKGMNAAYWTIPRLPRDNDWWSITTRLDQESSLLGRIHTVPSEHCSLTCLALKLRQRRGERQSRAAEIRSKSS